MIETSVSSARQEDVSVVDLGNGFTTVWLRKNHEQETKGEGDSQTGYWSCDEVCFTVQGSMTAEQAQASFDELWSEHEHDGETAEESLRRTIEELTKQMSALSQTA